MPISMPTTEQVLRQQLRDAGLTTGVIDAVWPRWWSDQAEQSVSATTELRYTLARRLGLAPSSLFDGPPAFIWRDDARFKNLGSTTLRESEILASFSVAVGRAAIAGVPDVPTATPPTTARGLRSLILQHSPMVMLGDLLAVCWAFGIPVLHLNVFPLQQKRMHAVSTRSGSRYAVLVGRESRFLAQVAYFVAHELGHVLLQHVSEASALLDIDDPLQSTQIDSEEDAANRFALELLTGAADPEIESDSSTFTATELAAAVVKAGVQHQVDPGVLALCFAHRTGQWEQAFGALKILPDQEQDVGAAINRSADAQLDWDAMTDDSREFLRTVLGLDR